MKKKKIDKRISDLFKKNQVTILVSNYYSIGLIDNEILNELNIHKKISSKRKLMTFLKSLTLDEITNKNIIITVSSRATLAIAPNELNACEITYNNIHIQRINYGRNNLLKINRTEFTLDDIKTAKRSLTINRVKKESSKDKETEEKIKELYKSLDIDLRIHNDRAIEDIYKLASIIVKSKPLPE